MAFAFLDLRHSTLKFLHSLLDGCGFLCEITGFLFQLGGNIEFLRGRFALAPGRQEGMDLRPAGVRYSVFYQQAVGRIGGGKMTGLGHLARLRRQVAQRRHTSPVQMVIDFLQL